MSESRTTGLVFVKLHGARRTRGQRWQLSYRDGDKLVVQTFVTKAGCRRAARRLGRAPAVFVK